MMAFNGILNAAQDWLLVQATVNYSMFTSCLSLNTVCPCVTHRVTGCGEEQASLLCVWMWGENKRISSVPGVWGKWTQCINLPGCSSPPNEVCEKSLLIKYRGCGRCLSFFIRKKGFLPSRNCRWERWCWWWTCLSLHGPIYSIEQQDEVESYFS